MYLRNLAASTCCLSMLVSFSVQADNLGETVEKLLTTHERVLAVEQSSLAANSRLDVASGEWFPELNVNAQLGREKINKPVSDDTNLTASKLGLEVEQLLWDFGKTNADIAEKQAKQLQSKIKFSQSRQELTLEAVVAFLDMSRAIVVRDSAAKSVENIKRQTELEDVSVQKGKGYSTDVLQAQGQLLGAMARLSRADGDLNTAISVVETVFNQDAYEVSALSYNNMPANLLPNTLEEAENIALDNSPDIQLSEIAQAEAQARKDSAEAEGFLPRLQAVASSSWQDDYDGLAGSKNEQAIFFEVSMPFNLGLTSYDSLNAASADNLSAKYEIDDARRKVLGAVRKAWYKLHSSRIEAQQLATQADITEEFLELARKERQLNRRTLLDVLAGETSLINAQSDAVSARTNEEIAAYTLLKIIGTLSHADL